MLLLIVLALLVVGGTLVLAGLGTGLNKGASSKQALTGNLTLQDVKQALIGYVVAPPASDRRPGTLPTPDSLANGNYNGEEDITCLGVGVNGMPAAGSTTPAKRCLGKLPWRKLGFETANADAHDPNGSVPWLAISANLHFDGQCLWVLNSDTLKLDSPMTETCPSPSAPYPQPTSLPHPWLTVVDENGAVLSNRVAAVLMLPGGPIQTETRLQSRTVASPGNPADYLDDIKLPLGCTSACMTRDNAGLTNTFVSLSPGTKYPATAQNGALRGELIPFNDQLVYITIDELAPYIERRVNTEAVKALRAFKASGNFSPSYPWISPFNTAPVSTTALPNVAGTYFGAFPFMATLNAMNPPAHATEFDWQLTGFNVTTSPVCLRVNDSPDLYIRPITLSTVSIPVEAGSCTFRGPGRVACEQVTHNLQSPFTVYSDGGCNTTFAAGVSLNIQRTYAYTAIFDLRCNSVVTPTFSDASITDVHRWNWSCASLDRNNSEVDIRVSDTYTNSGGTTYSRLPRSVDNRISKSSGAMSAAVNRMRYLPQMPTWFAENLWYQTTFAAIAPDAAPANSLPCSTFPKLTVNGNDNVDVAVIQAGKNIGMNARPSASLTDYLEGANVTGKTGTVPGMTNCSFSSATTSPAAALNDQITTILP